MASSCSLSHVLLGCAVLIALQSIGSAMECLTSEDEQVCQQSCQTKGYRYGRCDYSDCTCYGRTQWPNAASLMLANGPVDGSKFARPRLQVAPSTTRRPLKCTSVARKGRNEASSSGYEACTSWCRQTRLDIFVSLDNLCCCQKN